MESYSPLIGTPVEELDTPCLLLDLDALEHNFDVVSRTYEGKVCKMREHGKNIKSPVVGLLQIRAGGTVGGVCSAKVSEAEVMVAGGIEDILITNQMVTKDKIVRLCGLAKQADVKVAVDDQRNLRDLSAAAVDSGATLGIVIEVDTSMSRAGVRTAEEGVELARLAVELPGLVFRGVMSHQTLGGRSGDLETRKGVGEKFIQMCLDVRDAIEEAGIPVEIVSSGETFTYDIAAGMPGVTEVQGGTYALMTHRSVLGNVFKVAMKVLASVVSAPRPASPSGTWATGLSLLPQIPSMSWRTCPMCASNRCRRTTLSSARKARCLWPLETGSSSCPACRTAPSIGGTSTSRYATAS